MPPLSWSDLDWDNTPRSKMKIKHLFKDTFSSVQFSCSVVSDSLRPHESQHARPPCPSPTPGVHSDSPPSSPWCHPTISSSVIPFPPAPNPSQHQSLFQQHSSKAAILQHSTFFTIQLSHPYMTTEKTTALTRQTFVGKVMSLLLFIFIFKIDLF